MTYRDALAAWVERWKGLRAWGRPLEEVTFTLRRRRDGQSQTGTCWATQRRIVVYYHEREPLWMPLETVLHELAHAAAPAGDNHGDKWRSRFAAATEEVTGIAVALDDGHEYVEVNGAVCDALRVWWKSSGQEFAWSLVKTA